jgi:hypothetical protein
MPSADAGAVISMLFVPFRHARDFLSISLRAYYLHFLFSPFSEVAIYSFDIAFTISSPDFSDTPDTRSSAHFSFRASFARAGFQSAGDVAEGIFSVFAAAAISHAETPICLISSLLPSFTTLQMIH